MERRGFCGRRHIYRTKASAESEEYEDLGHAPCRGKHTWRVQEAKPVQDALSGCDSRFSGRGPHVHLPFWEMCAKVSRNRVLGLCQTAPSSLFSRLRLMLARSI